MPPAWLTDQLTNPIPKGGYRELLTIRTACNKRAEGLALTKEEEDTINNATNHE